MVRTLKTSKTTRKRPKVGTAATTNNNNNNNNNKKKKKWWKSRGRRGKLDRREEDDCDDDDDEEDYPPRGGRGGGFFGGTIIFPIFVVVLMASIGSVRRTIRWTVVEYGGGAISGLETVRVEETTIRGSSSSRIRDDDDDENDIDDDDIDDIDPLEDAESTAVEALRFLNDRKRSYVSEGRPSSHWKMRGTGYLYDRHGLLLSASTILPTTTDDDPVVFLGDVLEDDDDEAAAGEEVVVRIDDVAPFLEDEEVSRRRRRGEEDRCEKLTIWVRLNGRREILAGIATAVVDRGYSSRSSCHWEARFRVRSPGTYDVDVKVLVWNGDAPFVRTAAEAEDEEHEEDPIRCRHRKGGPEALPGSGLVAKEFDVDLGSMARGSFLGKWMYRPGRCCCEVCSRTPGCLLWATPPRGLQADRSLDGCELYFDFDPDDDDDDEAVDRVVPTRGGLVSEILLPPTGDSDSSSGGKNEGGRRREERRRRLVEVERMHGVRADGATNTPDDLPYFAGCGPSFQFSTDFPCVSGDLDDRVPIRDGRTTIAVAVSSSKGDDDDDDDDDTAEEPAVHRRRRRLCDASDEILGADESGSGGGRWIRPPWPDEDECGEHEFEPASGTRLELPVFRPENPRCWHRDDLRRIGGGGSGRGGGDDDEATELSSSSSSSSHRRYWRSSLREETRGFYGHWRKDDCDYLEYATQKLQRCVAERRITGIVVTGASIARNLRAYVEQRTKGIAFHVPRGGDDDETFAEIRVDTLQLLHRSYDDDEHLVDRFFRDLPVSDARTERYLFGPFFHVSEPKPLVFADRQRSVSLLAQKEVLSKNWTVLDAWSPSLAFAYDAYAYGDDDSDGIHLVGPPMKAVVTKLFHHVCFTNNDNEMKKKKKDDDDLPSKETVVGEKRERADWRRKP